VEVKADGRQRARAPWRITAQQRNRDDEPKEEHAVAGRAVRGGVGMPAPEDAKPVEIRHRPRQHDDEAIPRGDSRQVGDDPAEANVRQEMRRRKHGGYLTAARSRFTSSSYEARLMIASNWARRLSTRLIISTRTSWTCQRRAGVARRRYSTSLALPRLVPTLVLPGAPSPAAVTP